MSDFLSDLASRRRFGMKPGLDNIRDLCSRLGSPQEKIPAIHIAGTNGKGAVCAILDSCCREARMRVARYTSPHLVKLNERFFLDGAPIRDNLLAIASSRVENVIATSRDLEEITFFEALTAVAFLVFAEEKVDLAILETGLGGRLDATNICSPIATVITRIGLDHCDWLGDSVEKIAREKAGIIKSRVPIILGENEQNVVAIIRDKAREMEAPFFYAPEIIRDEEIPEEFSLNGSFNRENAITALATLKVIASKKKVAINEIANGFKKVIWPGRFQKVGKFLIDGAHNPPAATALARALATEKEKFVLIAGFCGDKDIRETLAILKPYVKNALAIPTKNPRSLKSDELAMIMSEVGIDAVARDSLAIALKDVANVESRVLICGSLFLAGEALVELNAYPWDFSRFDPAESLTPQ